MDVWQGKVERAETPRAIITRLNRELLPSSRRSRMPRGLLTGHRFAGFDAEALSGGDEDLHGEVGQGHQLGGHQGE